MRTNALFAGARALSVDALAANNYAIGGVGHGLVFTNGSPINRQGSSQAPCHPIQASKFMNTKHILSGVFLALLLGSAAACADEASELYERLKAGKCQPALGNLQSRAAAGEAAAQNWLGEAYDGGKCCAKDQVLAAKWFRKAAEQKYALGQYNLGTMYAHGAGLPKDERQAVEWYRKAAAQGHADAQYNLGVSYNNGAGVAKDDRQAVKWYRLAAEQGDASAQSNLGLMYNDGTGVSQDYRQAAKWFRKAAEQGDANAQNNLGDSYETGQGVPENHAEAARWYELAARQGNVWGQRGLAGMLRDGRGVTRDLVRAHAWMKLASTAATPHPEAAGDLDELARRLNPAQLVEAQRLAREWKLGTTVGASRVK